MKGVLLQNSYPHWTMVCIPLFNVGKGFKQHTQNIFHLQDYLYTISTDFNVSSGSQDTVSE